jgi:uncharacterized membrane-anchored protein
MLRLIIACLALLVSGPVAARPFADVFPDDYADISPEYRAGLDAMDLQQGRVFLKDNTAYLTIPDGYYFLGSKDAAFVLEKLWDNPPDDTVLGMVFPIDASPFTEGSWAITVAFDAIGYVSDEDAAAYDYAALLADMQTDVADGNTWRKENGYAELKLMGWASPPRYDQTARQLHWAKRLQFADSEGETLNYNIRALGRKGVLIVDFIAGIKELPMVEKSLPDVLSMISFTEGNRYSDYLPGTDTLAAVGIGGLIAGKVIAKSGLLLVALLFLKKFAVLLILPIAALWRRFRGKDTSV